MDFLSHPLSFPTESLFSVEGPLEPVVVSLGEDASLPCQLLPEQSAAHMHIRWYRGQLSPAVLVFQDGQEHSDEQMLEYRGRTQLVANAINKGSVTLLIQHVRASDAGQYWCHFRDGDVFQDAIMELNVVGMCVFVRMEVMESLEEVEDLESLSQPCKKSWIC